MTDNNEQLRERLQQLVDLIGKEEVQGIAAVALREIPKKLSSIKDGLERGALEEVSRMAHGLKGDTGTLGIDDMADTAKILEGAGKPDQEVDGLALLQELTVQYQSAETILQEFT